MVLCLSLAHGKDTFQTRYTCLLGGEVRLGAPPMALIAEQPTEGVSDHTNQALAGEGPPAHGNRA